ncbi:GspE/PulE family protein [bacterium]|nr:GspE/PulE family protein [bacterium]
MLLDKAARYRESVTTLTEQITNHNLMQGSEVKTRPEIGFSEELLGNDPDHPKIVRLVNTILADAVNCRASDIHLEPDQSGLKIRFRVDGLLEDRDHVPPEFAAPVVSRIKVMAKMDVSRRLEPQDGSCSVTFGGRPVDVRVSTVPTPLGERLVMRLLDRSQQISSLKNLGLPVAFNEPVQQLLKQNQGLFLIAGPTGSGKTTTVYGCLLCIDTLKRNTITIEDPIEYDIKGISQIQVGRDRNLGFADGLRSLLRQDPDIIMVGEIRDNDTAATALKAALTGHLILSTIHTTDPSSAIIRLLDLGVERPLIAETLSAVLDQRLIRTLCPHCSVATGYGHEYQQVGCTHCRNTGWLGRTGLFRFMASTQKLRQHIRAGDHQAVRELVTSTCGSQLAEQANQLLAKGRTTHEEINRVLGNTETEK